MRTPVATTTFAGAGTWLNWDVTALADRWLKGSLPNQGVAILPAAGVTSLTLASSDNTTATQRPKLAVTFLPPCGWTPPATTVTLSPLADVDINKDVPTTNFGAEPDLYLAKGSEAHPLLKFDLSGIAAGKTVQSATLRLYFAKVRVNGSSATKTSKTLTLNVHASTRSWKEMEANWTKWQLGSGNTNWTTQGGDYRSHGCHHQVLAHELHAGRVAGVHRHAAGAGVGGRRDGQQRAHPDPADHVPPRN